MEKICMNLNNFQFSSLKTRVTLFTLAVFVSGIWSLSFYTSRMLHKDMENVLGAQQFSTVSLVASEINTEFEDRLKALEIIAGSLSQAMITDKANVQKLLEQRPVFQKLFNGGTFITGPDGTAIADVSPSTRRTGINYSDRDYLIAALSGKANISQPVISRALNTPVFVLAVPIRNPQDKVIGVMAGVVNLGKANFLDRIIQHRYGTTGGYLLIAPQHKLFVTATDKSRIMQPLPPPGINKMHDRYMQGFEGFGIAVNSRGIEELSATKYVPLAGWFVVSVLPTDEAFAPIHIMLKNILLATILLTLLAGGVTWWMARLMLKRHLSPILATSRSLSDLSLTKQPVSPLPITSKDEIGELIGGFNHLLETLKQREDELQQQKKHLAEIIDFLPDATLAIDKDKRVIIWNKAIEDMTGVPASEMLGKGDHAYTIPFYGERRSQLMDLVFENDPETMSRYENISKEGNSYSAEAFSSALYNNRGAWIFVKASPLFDHSGDMIGVIESIRDITERKHLEDKLLQSHKMESVGRLAGGVAHDFNNKLAVILGYSELLKMKYPDDQELQEELTEISKAAEHSRDMTGQLLAFSRQQLVSPRIINPNDLVNDTKKTLPRLIGADIVISFQLGKDLWNISIDPVQMDQIIMNLTLNARDAMPNGGDLLISTANSTIDEKFCLGQIDAKPGDYVQLSISDNGHGMDEHIIKHIFEPFFTTKEVGKGTGLGLATIYGIVTQNQGFITVSSKVCQGTTFNVYLPRAAEGMSEESIQESQPIKGTGTVLLVEDDETVRKMVTLMLKRIGYTVLTVETPMEAVHLCEDKDTRIDIILSDVIMPDMNGKDMLDWIMPLRPGLKALFMSGYSSEIISQNGITEGSLNFIQKPFDMQTLNEKIEEVMKHE